MKMKNYKTLASFAALMIIGLLVITGCSDLFQPPIKTAGDGNGTLSVSVNGADGRTILPAARLDKYELTLSVLTGNAYAAYTGAYPKDLQGTTAFPLPPGTYKVAVKGYVDGEVVADGEEEGIVITADDSASISIILEPYETGNGTFSWDFDVGGVTTTAIKIYAIDNDTTAVKNSTDKAGDFELAAGVYNVKFEVTAFGKEYAWWEILYIYNGLTSVYGNADLVALEVLPTIPYVVPTSNYGYFYLDLNDWKTQTPASAGINDNVPKAVTSVDGIAVTFTENNQRVNFKLTSAQTAVLLASASSIKITIAGSGGGDTNFRYFLGDALVGSNWNATSGSGEHKFSELVAGKHLTTNDDDEEIEVDNNVQTFNANKSANTLGYFILQQRAAVTNTLTINSIKIEFTLTEEGFDLDLSKTNKTQAGDVATTDGLANSPGLASATFTAGIGENPGTLVASFIAANQRIAIPLSTDLSDIINNDASTVYITIWGSADPDANFRYHIGDPTAGGNWNATSGAGHTEFSNLASADGKTNALSITNPERVASHLILQKQNADASTVTINKIKVEWVEKEIPPAVPATESFVFFRSTDLGGTDTPVINASPVNANWFTFGELNAVGPIVFPTGYDIRSYKSFTIAVKYYLNDNGAKGDEISVSYGNQWAQVNIGGVDHYNLGEENGADNNCTINAPIAAKHEALAGVSSVALNFQARGNNSAGTSSWKDITDGTVTGDLGFVELHEIVFYAEGDSPWQPPFDIGALDGIKLGVAGDATLSDDGTVVTVDSSKGGLFYVAFEDTDYEFDATDTIIVTYAAIAWPGGDQQAHLIAKQGVNNWVDTLLNTTSASQDRYPRFGTTQKGTFKILPGAITDANKAGFGFQHNSGDNTSATPKYQIKILSVFKQPFDIDALAGGIKWKGVAKGSGDDDLVPVLSTDETVVTVTASKGSLFWIAFADIDGFPADFNATTDTLTITYAAIVWPGDAGAQAKITFKKGVSSWNTINNGGSPNWNAYKSFETGESKTLTLPAGSLDAADTGISFQHNYDSDSENAYYRVKILSVAKQ